jgi:hypothetical protein
MYTLGLDTIAGAKLLQVKFGRAGVLQPNQAVMHGNRRARFIRITDGVALIRHWGSSNPVAVPLEALSLLPPEKQRSAALRPPAGAEAHKTDATPWPRRVGRADMQRAPRLHRQRRPLLRP